MALVEVEGMVRVATRNLAPLPADVSDGIVTLGTVDTELGLPRLAAHGLGLPTAPDVLATMLQYNGDSTLELVEGNRPERVLLASAPRTASTNTANQTNRSARGVIVYLHVTAVPGTGGLYFRVLSSLGALPVGLNNWGSMTKITATGKFALILYPGAIPGDQTNSVLRGVIGLPLPRRWYVQVVHEDASEYTYSLSVEEIV